MKHMMNKKLLKLAQRRECMVLDTAKQRVHLALAVIARRAPLFWAACA